MLRTHAEKTPRPINHAVTELPFGVSAEIASPQSSSDASIIEDTSEVRGERWVVPWAVQLGS
jgi:hypothetical protein